MGDIRANEDQPSILVVSESATVTGALHADHIIISGTVKGPVHAAQMLELQPKARIEGDVHYRALEMHQGAAIDGEVRAMRPSEERPALKLAASSRL